LYTTEQNLFSCCYFIFKEPDTSHAIGGQPAATPATTAKSSANRKRERISLKIRAGQSQHIRQAMEKIS
jgi:hypothetical protein